MKLKERLIRLLTILYAIFKLIGIDFRLTGDFLKGIIPYIKDFIVLKKQRYSSKQDFPFGVPYPCLGDRFEKSGSASGHYFHQDLHVARKIFLANPKIHVDIGSRVDGFVAHVASFRKITVFDIRSLSLNIPNIKFIQADLMTPIPKDLKNYCDSISCLHAIEHFGLGRYGDPVMNNGHLSGLKSIYDILKKGGKFYFSAPIGPQRIEFNAHRVFSLNYLLNLFEDQYQINDFSYVDDLGNLYMNQTLCKKHILNNFGCSFGCAIIEMTKI